MKPCDFKSVEGKVVIITGAASGIGRAMAKVFAANGMKVVIADIQDELGAKVVAEITENGGEAMYIHTNVADEENVISTIKPLPTNTVNLTSWSITQHFPPLFIPFMKMIPKPLNVFSALTIWELSMA